MPGAVSGSSPPWARCTTATCTSSAPRATHHDEVVVSIFVNPTQFNDAADLAAYPRVEASDAEAAANAGADLLFAPSADEMYPDGFATTVHVGGPSERLEGASRPGHFDGVATVVAKLLNMVGADVAYFGQKDAQQLAVVRRMVADLNIPTQIEAVATVREPDGLALSSRNARLAPARPRAAPWRSRGRCAPPSRTSRATRDVRRRLRARRGARAHCASAGVEPDYVELVDPDHLHPTARRRRRRLLAVAARVGDVRLIDNLPTDPEREPLRTRCFVTMMKSKIHRATVTDCDLHYVGSITVDPDLLEAADILPHEQVHVVDVDNGARFETYTIEGTRGSGEMKVNGAAARLVHRGDTIIVISYAQYDRERARDATSPAWSTSNRTRIASSTSTPRSRPFFPEGANQTQNTELIDMSASTHDHRPPVAQRASP